MSADGCQNEDDGQGAHERKQDDVVNHDPSSLESLYLSDNTRNPVARILFKQLVNSPKVLIRSIWAGGTATLQRRSGQGKDSANQKRNTHPHRATAVVVAQANCDSAEEEEITESIRRAFKICSDG